MGRQLGARERRIHELSKKNRWYEYERRKTHLSHQNREAEVKYIAKHLEV